MSEEILNAIIAEKQIEKERSEMAATDYAKRTDGELLNHEKQILKRRLLEIEREENLLIPGLEKMKKDQLRSTVMKHISEKRKSNEAIKVRFEQNDLNRTKLYKGAV